MGVGSFRVVTVGGDVGSHLCISFVFTSAIIKGGRTYIFPRRVYGTYNKGRISSPVYVKCVFEQKFKKIVL